MIKDRSIRFSSKKSLKYYWKHTDSSSYAYCFSTPMNTLNILDVSIWASNLNLNFFSIGILYDDILITLQLLKRKWQLIRLKNLVILIRVILPRKACFFRIQIFFLWPIYFKDMIKHLLRLLQCACVLIWMYIFQKKFTNFYYDYLLQATFPVL